MAPRPKALSAKKRGVGFLLFSLFFLFWWQCEKQEKGEKKLSTPSSPQKKAALTSLPKRNPFSAIKTPPMPWVEELRVLAQSRLPRAQRCFPQGTLPRIPITWSFRIQSGSGRVFDSSFSSEIPAETRPCLISELENKPYDLKEKQSSGEIFWLSLELIF